ncbi:MAG: permease-like cell division protein FtsX [Propionibacteriaceae bacterium]|nr:permease-like cell division protein FtsX [Propionibacteriaceae bacterium]
MSVQSWGIQQGRAFRDSLGRFVHQPVGSLLNVLVIGVTLALPVALHVGIRNLDVVSRDLAADPQLTVFVDLEANPAEVEAVGRQLREHPAVTDVRFVSKAKALEDLKRTAGLADIVEEIGRNPLPDAFVVEGRAGDPDSLEGLRAEAAKWPSVDHAQLDTDWARQLQALLRMARTVTILVAGLLGVALVAATFNTIRLQLLTRREEIQISKLIGATDAFVRRPFLHFGALLGIAGGLLAWALVIGAAYALQRELGPLIATLLPEGQLRPLTLEEGGLLVAAAGILGWLGAWFSVAQHLGRIRRGLT